MFLFARTRDSFYDRKGSVPQSLKIGRVGMNKSLGAFIGIITGFAVGVAVGMAVAPRPGDETREKIKKRVKWQFWSPRQRYQYLWKRTCGV
jgi:hypothetical protein